MIIILCCVLLAIFINTNFVKNKQRSAKKVEIKSYSPTKEALQLITDKKFITLYYTEHDCPTCVSTGFRIIRKLYSEKNNKEMSFYIFGRTEKVKSDSIGYQSPISIRKDDIHLKKHLNYINTPVIIINNKKDYNAEWRIIKVGTDLNILNAMKKEIKSSKEYTKVEMMDY